jgi:general secretion pathway protein B
MDARMTQRRHRLPIWAVALGVLLAVNLLVLTVILTRKSTPAAQAPQRTEAPSPPHADASPAAATKHFSPLDPAPVYAPEIPVAAAESSVPVHSPMTRSAGDPVHHPDPLLTEAVQDDNQEVLPTISEISLTGAQALPELHLDVHVYATKPAERFVYINMRKYHEGATLEDGPLVERIRRDGVVLKFQGLRFILPRQP